MVNKKCLFDSDLGNSVVESFFIKYGTGLFWILFCFVFFVSFYDLGASISFRKYFLFMRIDPFLGFFDLFKADFFSYFKNTMTWHQGDSESGLVTFIFSFPFYVLASCLKRFDVILLNAYSSALMLGALVCLYFYLRKYFGATVAFLSSFTLGLSSCFQELARCGNYHSLTIFAAVGIIFLFYEVLFRERSIIKLLFLAVLLGLGVYSYGVIRPLIGFIAVYVLMLPSKKLGVDRKIDFTVLLLCIAGIGLFYKCISYYEGHWFYRFFDEEFITNNDYGFVEIGRDLVRNLYVAIKRLLGFEQVLWKCFVVPWKNDYHAPFLHFLLFLPMCIGMIKVWFNRANKKFFVFMLISIVIVVPMLFTTKSGYAQARRSLLYILPIYTFVGIGLASCLHLLCSCLHSRLRRIFGILLMVALLSCVVSSEIDYIFKRICSSDRDSGVYEFSQDVKSYYKGKQYLFYVYSPEKAFPLVFAPELLRFLFWDYRDKFIIMPNHFFYECEYDGSFLIKGAVLDEMDLKDRFLRKGYSLREVTARPLENFKVEGTEYSDSRFVLYRIDKNA